MARAVEAERIMLNRRVIRVDPIVLYREDSQRRSLSIRKIDPMASTGVRSTQHDHPFVGKRNEYERNMPVR